MDSLTRAAARLPAWRGEAGARIMARLDALARHSSEADALTRLYLTDAHRDALATLGAWMREAGLAVRQDEVGNLIGRREGTAPGLPALLLGSHVDTVRNAGKYDGPLGIVAAIEAVARLNDTPLPFAIEILALGDEEGVRFPAALTGARAFAGTLDPATLAATDAEGITMRAALEAFGGSPDQIAAAARHERDVLAYLELHIEQGPVLEAEGLPVGIVTAIAGAERHVIEVTGVAGHAGTVPMALRHDALAAGAEMVLAAERIARETADLVATVGQMTALPGAVNVIPSAARFSLDIRSPSDAVRRDAVARLFMHWREIAARRGVTLSSRKNFEEEAAPCAPALMALLDAAVTRAGVRVRHLPSGAGHDGLAIASLCPIGMLFLRCRGGISHNPAEAIAEEDAGLAACILADTLRHFDPAPFASHAQTIKD
ncbi:allantoate amidohydrolase [Acidiphilium sp.]|uniref:allantoate amidohydrolase n=1 Tax=Acidiphilium sp. TaxID=527 RepID=UPI00258DB573|nr:allantoate amidohydrolase [Acidiphilium sp.]